MTHRPARCRPRLAAQALAETQQYANVTEVLLTTQPGDVLSVAGGDAADVGPAIAVS